MGTIPENFLSFSQLKFHCHVFSKWNTLPFTEVSEKVLRWAGQTSANLVILAATASTLAVIKLVLVNVQEATPHAQALGSREERGGPLDHSSLRPLSDPLRAAYPPVAPTSPLPARKKEAVNVHSSGAEGIPPPR